MTLSKSFTFAAVCALLPGIALAQPDKIAAAYQNQATFCEGTYALCIKAPCTPIPTIDRLGNYTYDRVACSCEIENGWSMGPGQCADRQPVKQGSLIYMISTYSNRFNNMNGTLKNTLTCTDAGTVWAWCYGAPCVVDERDVAKGKTTCTCPVMTSPMQTLGGSCNTGNCSTIWSAATIPGDVFANNHFYNYMKQNYPNYPANPPAELCVPPPKSPG